MSVTWSETKALLRMVRDRFAGPWWVVGGWALDLLAGEVTREHHDVEVSVFRKNQFSLRAMLADFDLYTALDGEWHPWRKGMAIGPPMFQVKACVRHAAALSPLAAEAVAALSGGALSGGALSSGASATVVHAVSDGSPRTLTTSAVAVAPSMTATAQAQAVAGLGLPPEFEFFLNDVRDDRWVYRSDWRISVPLDRLVIKSRGHVPCLRPEVIFLHKSKHHRPQDEQDFDRHFGLMDGGARDWLRRSLEVVQPDDPWIARL